MCQRRGCQLPTGDRETAPTATPKGCATPQNQLGFDSGRLLWTDYFLRELIKCTQNTRTFPPPAPSRPMSSLWRWCGVGAHLQAVPAPDPCLSFARHTTAQAWASAAALFGAGRLTFCGISWGMPTTPPPLSSNTFPSSQGGGDPCLLSSDNGKIPVCWAKGV